MTTFFKFLFYFSSSDSMKKRFKGKKNNLKKMLILFLGINVFIYSFFALLNYFYKTKLSKDDSVIVDLLFKNSTESMDIGNLYDLKSPSFLISYMFNKQLETKDSSTVVEIKEDQNFDNVVYIFNSHPKEEYSNSSLEAFSINPTVVTADYILKEYLKARNIGALVEKNSVVDILRQNNWKYGYSYKASRILLEEAYKNNDSLKIFIDLHRDSSKKNVTTVDIDGKGYAKVLFVIGLEYTTYENNLNFAMNLNNRIIQKNKNLTRGIMKKKGAGVNGVYNQDFHSNTLLIEVGGPENTLEEINNTIKILADVIADYLEATYEWKKEK